jgi:hypothetical protein
MTPARNRLPALLVATLGLLAAPSARALVVAGWDFSQYAGDGALTIDGANFVSTLDANYSNLDPTFNAGTESAQLGTLYFDGQFGSSSVDAGSGSEPFLPVAGSLNSNLDAPVQGVGDNPFDSFDILAFEGQQFTQLLSMSALAAVSVVVQADLTSVIGLGSNWSLTFGGRTTSGTSIVGVEFSTDGVSYADAGTVSLNANDTPRTVALPALEAATAFVRLRFEPSGLNLPVIDNVAILGDVAIIPEPATLLLLSVGMVALTSRRHRPRA